MFDLCAQVVNILTPFVLVEVIVFFHCEALITDVLRHPLSVRRGVTDRELVCVTTQDVQFCCSVK